MATILSLSGNWSQVTHPGHRKRYHQHHQHPRCLFCLHDATHWSDVQYRYSYLTVTIYTNYRILPSLNVHQVRTSQTVTQSAETARLPLTALYPWHSTPRECKCKCKCQFIERDYVTPLMRYCCECPANRYVFKSRLNCSASTAGSLRQLGSEFQTVGPNTEKARVPKVPRWTRGTNSWEWLDTCDLTSSSLWGSPLLSVSSY